MLALATESGSLGVGVVFWILFIIGVVFYGVGFYRDVPGRPYYFSGLFWWILIFLLGVGVFGWPIHG